MKFTSEDLMKAMGLSVGDRVKTNYGIFELFIDNDRLLHWKVIESNLPFKKLSFEYIYNIDFEILPRPKRVGELMCKEMNCNTCPIRIICLEDRHISNSLCFNLELYKKDQRTNFDQEIYDLLKARLDKEVSG